jgi:hypothetical protein
MDIKAFDDGSIFVVIIPNDEWKHRIDPNELVLSWFPSPANPRSMRKISDDESHIIRGED